jgi:sterol desaturase/sphingolipid hydroxylase (fatty acid hydroxylase superfamily)
MDKPALPWLEARGLRIAVSRLGVLALGVAVWAYCMDPAQHVEAFGRTWPVRVRPLLWGLAGFLLVEIALMAAAYARYRRRSGPIRGATEGE